MDAIAAVFLKPLGAAFCIVILTVVLLFWYSSRNHSYWKKRGVPFVKPFPIVGSVVDSFLSPQQDVEDRRYKQFGAVYGHYEATRPVLSVADPKLLRDILVKDFQFFMSRRVFSLGIDILDKMVSNVQGEDWKRIRTIITPTFSTGKLKRTINIFKECSMTLVQNFRAAADKGKSINAKKMYGAMTMDVIASSAFSTKLDSHNDPENKFTQMARKVFGTNITWRLIMFMLAPKVMSIFRISVFPPNAIEFFADVTMQIINERKRLGQPRNDFLQLLIDTTKEEAKEEKWEEDAESDLANNYGQEVAGPNIFKNSVTKNLSTAELVAQCVAFFLAGYDSSATTLAISTYFLALHPDIQEKARQEINDCLRDTKGELTYEAVQKMKYLDNIISETLRLYPPAARTERKADSDYMLGDTGIKIKKDMIVTIPIFSIHRDPRYFRNPEKFDPDRFTAEERASRDPYTYMPFGAGPRNCVGMRFALLQVKVCLICVISHFKINTCKDTSIPLKFHVGIGLLQPKDIYLEMERRDDYSLK